jgi:hypothetical protein
MAAQVVFKIILKVFGDGGNYSALATVENMDDFIFLMLVCASDY